MKRIVIAILVAILVFLSCSAAEDAAFRDAHTVLKDMGAGWNLGNSLDAWSGTKTRIDTLSSETSWGNPKISQDLIRLVKDSGFRTIRLPVTWFNHMDPETYQIDEAWMSRVETIVGWILDEGLYCILNVHHDSGSNNWLIADAASYDDVEKKFTAIWSQVAARFTSRDGHLLFEGYNEILDANREWTNPNKDSIDAANRLNQAFVDTVRATGGNNAERCLVVNTYAAQPGALLTRGMKVPDDAAEDRLIVEVHFYQPYQFTSEFHPKVTTWNKSAVNTCMSNLESDFIQKGYPVLIGEFGAVSKDNPEERLAWTRYVVGKAAELGIGCVWWDNGIAKEFQLFDRRALQVTQPEIVAAIIEETANGEKAAAEKAAALEQVQFNETNLCASAEKWSSWVDTTNGGQADIQHSGTGVRAAVSNPGKEAWHVQPAYSKLTIESGKTYCLSFDYTADPEQSVAWHLMKDYGDYAAYQEGVLDATGETQHFELVFTMEDPTDDNCKIAFDLGGSSKTVPFVFEVTNLTLLGE